MDALLKIQPTIFHDGERFPAIVSQSGLPQFYPNVFLVSDLRNHNCQYKTLEAAGNAIKVLRLWELGQGVDVVDRLTTGSFLRVIIMLKP